jgi:catechol 2,3-dioxygenase-like lactoylglutathione lyase family enzyme
VNVNHIGVTVGNLERGIEFYTSVLGLELLVGAETANKHTPGADRRAQVFGAHWGEMKLAHLADGNGTGVELFEFIEPAMVYPEEHFDYWRLGLSHLAFTVDDIEATMAALTAAGGEVRTDVHEVLPGCLICYCKDPWGNPIELSTGTYPQTHPKH